MRIACEYRIFFTRDGVRQEVWEKGWILAFVFSDEHDTSIAIIETTEKVLTESVIKDIMLSDQKGES